VSIEVELVSRQSTAGLRCGVQPMFAEVARCADDLKADGGVSALNVERIGSGDLAVQVEPTPDPDALGNTRRPAA
jgi:hypothetical protein